jgi:hypothetical protein
MARRSDDSDRVHPRAQHHPERRRRADSEGLHQVSNHVLVSATSGTHTRFAEVIHWTLVMVELSTAIHWTLVMRNLDFGDD